MALKLKPWNPMYYKPEQCVYKTTDVLETGTVCTDH